MANIPTLSSEAWFEARLTRSLRNLSRACAGMHAVSSHVRPGCSSWLACCSSPRRCTTLVTCSRMHCFPPSTTVF